MLAQYGEIWNASKYCLQREGLARPATWISGNSITCQSFHRGLRVRSKSLLTDWFEGFCFTVFHSVATPCKGLELYSYVRTYAVAFKAMKSEKFSIWSCKFLESTASLADQSMSVAPLNYIPNLSFAHYFLRLWKKEFETFLRWRTIFCKPGRELSTSVLSINFSLTCLFECYCFKRGIDIES